ncbi:zinc finger protein PLAG1-like [Anneissia japonica]|uniref:zinc finger protein PLAG1-like n=1 Tax=Anneissia japonica TaxID=1529436 RepID=UPI00142584BB|nr:zinc finger protein PLAG1-like [Anneissia japonica]
MVFLFFQTPFTPMVRNIRRRVCARCQARFTSKSALRRHMAEQHEGRVRLVCLFCDRAFSRKYDLKRHLQDKHTATENNNISPTSSSTLAKTNPPALQNPRLIGNSQLPLPPTNERQFPPVQQQAHSTNLRPLAQPASSATGRVNTMHHHHHMNINGPTPLRLPHVNVNNPLTINSTPGTVLQQRSPTSNQGHLLIPPSVNTITLPRPTTSQGSGGTQHRRLNQSSVSQSQPILQRPAPSHTVVHAVQRSNETPQTKSLTTTAVQTEMPPKSEVQPVPRRPARRIVSETTTTELLDDGVVVARVTKTRNYEV